MTIFKTAVPEGYQWVVPVDDADFEVFREFDGRAKRHAWKPVRVRVLSEDERGCALRDADLPWLGSHVIVLSERAVNAIGEFLEPWGELLPLACDDKDLTVFNVCRVIDALDEERSDVVRFASGRVMKVNTHVFRADVVIGEPLFKLAQTLRGPIYAQEPLVQMVAAHDLRGTQFEPVWPASR